MKCNKCKFWQETKDASKMYEAEGECRKYTPKITPVPDRAYTHTEWPKVGASDWCGEFKEKKDKKKKDKKKK